MSDLEAIRRALTDDAAAIQRLSEAVRDTGGNDPEAFWKHVSSQTIEDETERGKAIMDAAEVTWASLDDSIFAEEAATIFQKLKTIVTHNVESSHPLLDVINIAFDTGRLLGRTDRIYLTRNIERQRAVRAYKESKANLDKATKISAETRSGTVRQAAIEDIRTNPNTTQGKCAERVAEKLKKSDIKTISRTIAPLFERRCVNGKFRDKRPKKELQRG